ncbi:hypothetical protein ACIBHX_22135 [Nonomuraea sp. NPDC050536]|uniref:hypothetical protein n=1 Tax=Nonomuraea sp. NPDC050536 TaxID=3364366 RepID=UPI0037C7D5DD
MTALERRYRRLLLAYPRTYRRAHGDELLDVLLESAEPDRRVPEGREALGLVTGGLRSRVIHQATGSPWIGGLHLGVTALAAANLAVMLPYLGTIPWWVTMSALALLAVQRGWILAGLPLTLAVGVKAVAIAGGWQVLDLTLIPVYPSLLTGQPLFSHDGPLVVAALYALVLVGLLVLATRPGQVRARSWWWWAVVPLAAWAGPQWMADDALFSISLSRMALEFAGLALAAAGGYLARDPRWAITAAIYLAAVSGELAADAYDLGLTRQHLAYWGLLGVLTAAACFAPYWRRHPN